jgi:hypothetical protein
MAAAGAPAPPARRRRRRHATTPPPPPPALRAALAVTLALACLRSASSQSTLASALAALDPDAAADMVACAGAATQGQARLSAPCAATLADLQAAAAPFWDYSSYDYAYSSTSSTTSSADYAYYSSDYAAAAAVEAAVLAFLSGALANTASDLLPDFCDHHAGASGAAGMSCAGEVDAVVAGYLNGLAAGGGSRPGCTPEAGAAAASGAAAAVSLLSRATCLRAEPAAGGAWCLASLPAALDASGA